MEKLKLIGVETDGLRDEEIKWMELRPPAYLRDGETKIIRAETAGLRDGEIKIIGAETAGLRDGETKMIGAETAELRDWKTEMIGAETRFRQPMFLCFFNYY